MKKLTVGIITLSLLIGTQTMAQAGRNAPCQARSWITRHGIPTAERDWRVVRLAECASERWWPGHASEVLAIAWRESHYDPFAANPTSSARGLYQHLLTYWPGRAAAFLRRDWFKVWPVPWWNARAQTIVTVRMMAAQGGVCPAWC